jgi:hypothetical protein
VGTTAGVDGDLGKYYSSLVGGVVAGGCRGDGAGSSRLDVSLFCRVSPFALLRGTAKEFCPGILFVSSVASYSRDARAIVWEEQTVQL